MPLGSYFTDAHGNTFYRDPATGQLFNAGGYVQPMPPSLPAVELPTQQREMPVIGYRGWKWTERFRLGYGTQGTLASTGMAAVWVNGSLSAVCHGGASHRAPDP